MACPGSGSGRRSTPHCAPWGSPTAGSTRRRGCPAVSGSGWPSRACWRCVPGCCCSTSPPRCSTPRAPGCCAPRCAGFSPRPARPAWSSSTGWPTGWGTSTGWRCWSRGAGSWRTALRARCCSGRAPRSPSAACGCRGVRPSSRRRRPPWLRVPGGPPLARPPWPAVAGERARPALLVATDLAAGQPGAALPVVRDLDLPLRAGIATCVTGPNGAGKSTVAHVLGGLVPPVSGSLRAQERLGRGVGPGAGRRRPRELVTRIGTVFQEPQHQFVAATVHDELAVGPRRAGRTAAEAGARADELLERLGLAALARANPFTLSGGEQRRLSVATALATRPDLLVLDEPTFGQDPRTWAELVRLLRELLDDGVAVLAVTHDRTLVDVLGDEELVLPGGGGPVAAGSLPTAAAS